MVREGLDAQHAARVRAALDGWHALTAPPLSFYRAGQPVSLPYTLARIVPHQGGRQDRATALIADASGRVVDGVPVHSVRVMQTKSWVSDCGNFRSTYEVETALHWHGYSFRLGAGIKIAQESKQC